MTKLQKAKCCYYPSVALLLKALFIEIVQAKSHSGKFLQNATKSIGYLLLLRLVIITTSIMVLCYSDYLHCFTLHTKNYIL